MLLLSGNQIQMINSKQRNHTDCILSYFEALLHIFYYDYEMNFPIFKFFMWDVHHGFDDLIVGELMMVQTEVCLNVTKTQQLFSSVNCSAVPPTVFDPPWLYLFIHLKALWFNAVLWLIYLWGWQRLACAFKVRENIGDGLRMSPSFFIY